MKNKKDIVELLLSKGADSNIRDNLGKKPLDIVEKESEIYALLTGREVPPEKVQMTRVINNWQAKTKSCGLGSPGSVAVKITFETTPESITFLISGKIRCHVCRKEFYFSIEESTFGLGSQNLSCPSCSHSVELSTLWDEDKNVSITVSPWTGKTGQRPFPLEILIQKIDAIREEVKGGARLTKFTLAVDSLEKTPTVREEVKEVPSDRKTTPKHGRSGISMIEKRDSQGMTPLVKAAEDGKREKVESLLSNGADVNAKDGRFGCTPLHWAVRGGHREVVDLLLSHGSNINAIDNMGDTPLHEVSSRDCKGEIAEILISRGANINAKNKEGETPLHNAAFFGNEDTARVLVSKGASVNEKSNDGRTPLHKASGGGGYTGRKEVAEFLLSSGAEVNAKDNKYGWTPLHFAAAEHRKELVEVLLSKGADINAKGKDGKTPLDLAKKWHEIYDLINSHITGAQKTWAIGYLCVNHIQGGACKIVFQEIPESFEVSIEGKVSCIGCQNEIDFIVNAWKGSGGSKHFNCIHCGNVIDIMFEWTSDNSKEILMYATPFTGKIDRAKPHGHLNILINKVKGADKQARSNYGERPID